MKYIVGVADKELTSDLESASQYTPENKKIYVFGLIKLEYYQLRNVITKFLQNPVAYEPKI